MTTGFILEAASPMLGMWDSESPVNKPGLYDQAWDAAWEFDRDPPGGLAWKHEDMEAACERFDQYWNHRQARGEVLVWKPGSGVYRVELRILPPKPKVKVSKTRKEAFLGGQDVESVLRCPSGSIVVGCLKSLGSSGLQAAATVPPGEYRVGLDVNKAQLAKPRPFKIAEDYPKSNGPDFVLSLQKK